MSALLIILIVLASISLLVILVGVLIEYFGEYKGRIDQHGPKLKLKSFLTFYAINPDRWILHEWCVTCKIPRENHYPMLVVNYTEEGFHFSYIDTCRYCLWYKNLQKRKTKQSLDKSTLRMLEAVKLDIAAIEDQSQREINEAKSILKGVYDVKS
jgi:hypothetical protein